MVCRSLRHIGSIAGGFGFPEASSFFCGNPRPAIACIAAHKKKDIVGKSDDISLDYWPRSAANNESYLLYSFITEMRLSTLFE